MLISEYSLTSLVYLFISFFPHVGFDGGAVLPSHCLPFTFRKFVINNHLSERWLCLSMILLYSRGHARGEAGVNI